MSLAEKYHPTPELLYKDPTLVPHDELREAFRQNAHLSGAGRLLLDKVMSDARNLSFINNDTVVVGLLDLPSDETLVDMGFPIAELGPAVEFTDDPVAV